MAKASPSRNSFNAGEFSPLVEARTDIDRYPASMRRIENFIALPQGPAMRRSGTYFTTTAHDETNVSAIQPFVFADDQAFVVEFAHQRIRFVSEEGLQAYSPANV